MQVFDNIQRIVKDDLAVELMPDCRLSIAAACFSIYAYQELKSQRENISEYRFFVHLSDLCEGLTLDAVYENFIHQIAGERLAQSGEASEPEQNLAESIARSKARQKLKRQIAALEKKIMKEKQFSLQVELNTELKKNKG